MSFTEQLKLTAEQTEKRLTEIFADNKRYTAERLNDAMEYSVLGGGKRLRAYLAAEFCELCGCDGENALDYGAALEMIHAFSLIHDDLPAMDNDDMRRGKPSNHKAFGEATAILAGDALALDAFSVAGNNGKCSELQNARAMRVISEKAGSHGMCAGQQYDIDGEGKTLTLDELIALVDCKTGALFEGACLLGCIAGNGNAEQAAAAERFGKFTGRAFQIADDLLDIYSTAEELGKTVGKDTEQEKSTFVSLLGEEEAKRHAEECIKEAKNCLNAFENSDAKQRLTEFCSFIVNRKS